MNATDQGFACPGCGERLGVSKELWGSKARCPACQCKFVIGEPPEILEPPQPAPRPAAVVPKPAPANSARTTAVSPPARKRRPIAAMASTVLLLGALGAGGWFAQQHGWLSHLA